MIVPPGGGHLRRGEVLRVEYTSRDADPIPELVAARLQAVARAVESTGTLRVLSIAPTARGGIVRYELVRNFAVIGLAIAYLTGIVSAGAGYFAIKASAEAVADRVLGPTVGDGVGGVSIVTTLGLLAVLAGVVVYARG